MNKNTTEGKTMKIFSKELRSIFNKLIYIEQKPVIHLTDNEKVLHDSQKVCFFCKKNFVLIKMIKIIS